MKKKPRPEPATRQHLQVVIDAALANALREEAARTRRTISATLELLLQEHFVGKGATE